MPKIHFSVPAVPTTSAAERVRLSRSTNSSPMLCTPAVPPFWRTEKGCCGVVVPMPTLPFDSVMAELPSVPAPSVNFANVLAVVESADAPGPVAAAAFLGEGAGARPAEVRTVPSGKTMPSRARIVPATSSVACGLSVPMPTRPSGVTRICSFSLPEKRSPVRKVRAPEVEVNCPSRPSCAVTVAACAFFVEAAEADASGVCPAAASADAYSDFSSSSPFFRTATRPASIETALKRRADLP